jgi:hypothetical protein
VFGVEFLGFLKELIMSTLQDFQVFTASVTCGPLTVPKQKMVAFDMDDHWLLCSAISNSIELVKIPKTAEIEFTVDSIQVRPFAAGVV